MKLSGTFRESQAYDERGKRKKRRKGTKGNKSSGSKKREGMNGRRRNGGRRLGRAGVITWWRAGRDDCIV